MISHIRIKDFAIIDNIEIDFSRWFKYYYRRNRSRKIHHY